MGEKRFLVGFKCASCDDQAVVFEADNRASAEQKMKFLREHHYNEPVLATCPSCGQTRYYYANLDTTPPYIQEVEA